MEGHAHRRVEERRRAPRIPVTGCPVAIRRLAGRRWVPLAGATRVADLSTGGVRVHSEAELRVGDRLDLVFDGGEGAEGAHLRGRVVRVERRPADGADVPIWQAGCRLGPAGRGGSGAARDRDRLEGARLAARTAQHELNNALAVMAGYAELLAADDRLPPDARQWAAEARRSAYAAADVVTQLVRIRRLVEVTPVGPVASVLNLARSTQPDDPPPSA